MIAFDKLEKYAGLRDSINTLTDSKLPLIKTLQVVLEQLEGQTRGGLRLERGVGRRWTVFSASDVKKEVDAPVARA